MVANEVHKSKKMDGVRPETGPGVPLKVSEKTLITCKLDNGNL